jgi:hypothetical protein
MALTEYTVTIINKNTDPTVVGEGYKPLVVISPSGITTPQTPYDEWVADSATLLSGAVSIPAWKKLQYFILPASSKLVIMTDIADEAVYYQEMIGKYKNVEITVSTAPITTYKLTLSYGKVVQGGSAVTPTTTADGFTLAHAAYSVDVATTVATIDATTGALTAVADTEGQVVTVTVTGDTGTDNGEIPVSATTKVTIAAE